MWVGHRGRGNGWPKQEEAEGSVMVSWRGAHRDSAMHMGPTVAWKTQLGGGLFVGGARGRCQLSGVGLSTWVNVGKTREGRGWRQTFRTASSMTKQETSRLFSRGCSSLFKSITLKRCGAFGENLSLRIGC